MSGEEMVTVYIMGKRYRVPANLTIMKAMEYAGYQLRRGAGCRGGFCGACSTIYRMRGSFRLQVALACQKMVEDGMIITQLPFIPSEKKRYNLEKLKPVASVFLEYYPEIARCLSCNTCTKACPQDLMVMDYVQAAIRGDIKAAAELSFDCISCGLCAVRCPAEIVPYHIGQLARRLYSRYVVGPSEQVQRRAMEVEMGGSDEEIQRLKSLDTGTLRGLYSRRG